MTPAIRIATIPPAPALLDLDKLERVAPRLATEIRAVIAERDAAYRERDQLRDAARALVDTLPRCDVTDCNALASFGHVAGLGRRCPEHRGERCTVHGRGPSGEWLEFERASAQTRLAGLLRASGEASGR